MDNKRADRRYRSPRADRFQVALHYETKPMTAYALTVSNNGARLKEYDPAAAAKDDDTPPRVGNCSPARTAYPF